MHRLNKKGFTIVEVMIVLAIATLLLVIVLIAVPALQRNSRNTEKKHDVNDLIGGIVDYSSTNGYLPYGFCTTGLADDPIIFVRPSIATDIPISVKLGFFNQTTEHNGSVNGSGGCSSIWPGGTSGLVSLKEVHLLTTVPQLFPGGPAGTNDHLAIFMDATCTGSIPSNQDTTFPTLKIINTAPGQFAIAYLIETGQGKYVAQCTDG